MVGLPSRSSLGLAGKIVVAGECGLAVLEVAAGEHGEDGISRGIFATSMKKSVRVQGAFQDSLSTTVSLMAHAILP